MQATTRRTLAGSSLIALSTIFTPASMADAITNALTHGKAYGDFRLRYEAVDQDNALKDADALTIRSRLGYKTGEVNGFSATMEFEDTRTVSGLDDYNNTVDGKTEYSVIADPETTELDQALIQYTTHGLSTKLGRQVLTYDNHRFVGSVGWRQDRQTFDGITFTYSGIEKLKLNYAYIEKRNRIFADDKDIDAKDHLVNASLKTPIGKLTGYGYLLEEDLGLSTTIDTYGLRFAGSAGKDMQLLYALEYATQEKSDDHKTDFDADYMLLEGGIKLHGITAKLGYEVLGSDDGDFGFTTPLATLHKFNGWSDQFLNTPKEGLVDAYASVSGKLFGGGWTITYHDFSADEDSAISEDFGDEINISYARKFGKNYNAGIKYAAYSADDPANGGAKSFVDTDKLWLWVGASF